MINNTLLSEMDEIRTERVAYRLVYLRPNHASDEQIVVGILGESEGRIDARFISSESATETLVRLIGVDGVEQFNFASSEARRTWRVTKALGEADPCTDIFSLGDPSIAVTSDRSNLYKEILEVSSILMRTCSIADVNEESSTQTQLTKTLFEQVSYLNPLVAKALFSKRKIKLNTGDFVEIPIFGSRIFGAPVSFASRQLSQPRIRAEAYVAKFNWVRRELDQEPCVYVLAPEYRESNQQSNLDTSLRELMAIAEASRVRVHHAQTVDALAVSVLQDEAA